MAVVALWADSTYTHLEEARVREIAAELHFSLDNFVVTYGAGLVKKGDETASGHRAVKHTVIIEMGYNDDTSISPEKAVLEMRKRVWFQRLSVDRSLVTRVIFIAQPSYRQVRGIPEGILGSGRAGRGPLRQFETTIVSLPRGAKHLNGPLPVLPVLECPQGSPGRWQVLVARRKPTLSTGSSSRGLHGRR